MRFRKKHKFRAKKQRLTGFRWDKKNEPIAVGQNPSQAPATDSASRDRKMWMLLWTVLGIAVFTLIAFFLWFWYREVR
jgi:hypothetical protein